eukprot:11655464-Heterocapsa_arctica.AAC.1
MGRYTVRNSCRICSAVDLSRSFATRVKIFKCPKTNKQHTLPTVAQVGFQRCRALRPVALRE